MCEQSKLTMRIAPRTASLHTKLMLTLAVVVVAMAAASVTVLTSQERERRMRELDARADRIAALFSRSLAPTLWTVDYGAVKGQLEALAPNPEVVSFRVRAGSEGVIAEVVRQPRVDPSQAVVREAPILFTPHGSAPQEVGRVEVVFTRALAEAAISSARNTITALIVSVMVVLYAVTFWLLRRLVGRPIARMEAMVDRIAKGDFAARCAVDSEDELGRLATRVNAMADALDESTTSLRRAAEDLGRHRDELEATVRQRTAQLEEARQRADEARQRAEEASRAKSDFLANMSHEIRTPMNAILGMAQLAMRTELDSRQHNYVQKVHAAAESLLGIVNDILDFSKIEAGKLDVERVDFDLADVLDNLANVLGMKAEEKGLELLYIEPPDLPHALVGDPLRLSQVLLNLGNNAVKFTERGEVALTVKDEAHGPGWVDLRFEVRDTGIGIDRAQRERLFQPFEQADASTSRRHGGTGLGLAISRQLVMLMGGELEVHSELGQGSRFFFTLRFPVQESQPRPVPPRQDGLLGCRTLVVDDNACARELLAEMADRLGLRADCAADGEEALRKVAAAGAAGAPYELVLLDWKMPGMDGVDCAKRVCELAGANGPAPTVMMLTAFSREHVLRRLNEQGVHVAALLTKPVTPSTLFDACCQAMGVAVAGPGRAGRRDKARIEHHTRLEGARLLLVEDNEINRELALELLTGEGISVAVACDGREALQMLERERFDAVLMDCQMPVMDGFAATRALRAQPRWRDLPVIAMTANAMVSDRQKALDAGMNDHIAKPINVNQMFATLARWLGPRQAKDEPDASLAEGPAAGFPPEGP